MLQTEMLLVVILSLGHVSPSSDKISVIPGQNNLSHPGTKPAMASSPTRWDKTRAIPSGGRALVDGREAIYGKISRVSDLVGRGEPTNERAAAYSIKFYAYADSYVSLE